MEGIYKCRHVLYVHELLPNGRARPLAEVVLDLLQNCRFIFQLVHGRAYGKWEVPRSLDPPATCALQFWGDALAKFNFQFSILYLQQTTVSSLTEARGFTHEDTRLTIGKAKSIGQVVSMYIINYCF